jgi:putative ABC transport system permease protein
VTPWLKNNLGRPLKKGEVIGGSTIFVPAVSRYISIYGYNTTLAGNLDQTGSGIDQTIFMTEDTAREIAAQSNINAVQPLIMPERKVSSILVKVKSGTDVHRIATQITQSVSGVQVIETTNLFAIYRQQLTGLLQGSVLIILIFWVLALFLIGIIFSLTVNERRREIAVLRAIGATRGYVLRLTLAESAALAFAGALSGAVVSGTLLYLFQDLIARTIKMPFLLPSLNIMLVFFLIGLLLALVTVVFASLVPAYRLSRQDLAITMRE